MKDTSTCTTSTSVGTITEPDCLGPCEPGTSVTLEGIVWQETEGGKHLVFPFLNVSFLFINFEMVNKLKLYWFCVS